MIWILAGIIPPFLWSVVNHLDKYLLSKNHEKSSVDVLITYSTLFSLILLPFLYWFGRHELIIDLRQVIIQIAGGLLFAVSIYFYLKALFKDETSIVMPFVLLVPVFGYFFSYIILGEVLSFVQIIYCALILLGALILSIEIKEEIKFKLNHGVFFLMVISTSLQAMQETLFKFATINNSFVVSLFWLHIGIALCGIFLVIFKKHLFKHFIESVRLRGTGMLTINAFSELVVAVADAIRNYALLLAPVVVVMTFNSFQPAFVFIIGTILTIIAPKFVKEKIRPIHLIHKALAIAIMVTGAILIANTI